MFKLLNNFVSQVNNYSMILHKDDHKNKIQCRATNPWFDEINNVINDSSYGYSIVHYINVTCKYQCYSCVTQNAILLQYDSSL